MVHFGVLIIFLENLVVIGRNLFNFLFNTKKLLEWWAIFLVFWERNLGFCNQTYTHFYVSTCIGKSRREHQRSAASINHAATLHYWKSSYQRKLLARNSLEERQEEIVMQCWVICIHIHSFQCDNCV